MQLSLRSQLIAGVAALSLTAVAVAPVAQPQLSPSQVSGVVNLVAFDNPIAVLLATVDDVAFNIFDQAAVPPPAELYWPDSFYTPDFSFLFAPGYWGLIPDGVNQFSDGALSAFVSNISGYVSAASYGLTGLVSGATSAVWNIPFALVTAAGYLLSGQIDQALAELQTQILGPIVQGVSDAAQAIGYILDNSIANAATLISNTIPGLLANVIGSVVSGTVYLAESALATLGDVVSSLASLQLEDAWNGAVNGLLGPTGTLGQIENLLVGVGIIEDVEYDEGVVPTVTIPSLRSDLTSASQRLGDLRSYGDGGIRNDAFEPVTATSAAAVPVSPAAETTASVSEVTVDTGSADSASAGTATSAAGSVDVEVSRPVSDDASAAPASGSDSPASGSDSTGATAAASGDAATTSEKSAPSKRKATRGARAAG